MASIPTNNKVERFQLQTEKAIQKKKASQKRQGKSFDLPEGGGPGVIPERVWKNLPGKKEG